MIDSLMSYLSYPFVRYAFVVGLLISLSTALIGVVLVLRRFALIGDGLSHIAFGAMTIAAVAGISNNMIVVMPLTIIVAIFLLKGGQSARVQGDAAIAMLSVASLAFGYLLMNLCAPTSNTAGDVCSTLFGSLSILTLSQSDVIVSSTLSIIVVALFIVFYRQTLSVTFDESFAASSGINVPRYNLAFAVVSAVMIVLAMRLVGALLVSSLLVFPALTAMRLFKSFHAVLIAAALISTLATTLGLLVAILAETPVGVSIVGVDALFFALAWTSEKLA